MLEEERTRYKKIATLTSILCTYNNEQMGVLTGFLLRGLPCFLLGLIAIRCLAALWLNGTLVDVSPSAKPVTAVIIITVIYSDMLGYCQLKVKYACHRGYFISYTSFPKMWNKSSWNLNCHRKVLTIFLKVNKSYNITQANYVPNI